MTDPLEHLDFAPDAGPGVVEQMPTVDQLPMRCLGCGRPWEAEFLAQIAEQSVRARSIGAVTCECRMITSRATPRTKRVEHNLWVVFTSHAAWVRACRQTPKSRVVGIHFSHHGPTGFFT